MNVHSNLGAGSSKKQEYISAFADHLLKVGLLGQLRFDAFSKQDSVDARLSLRQLWKATDISSHEFANEIASFFDLPKLTLLELSEFHSLADRFAPRFLREASIFPFERNDGRLALAASDPGDLVALQAAEIVFGAPYELVVASFEDIAAVLGEKTEGHDAAAAGGADHEGARADENAENLRDLASGAPVVRAVNDLIEKAIELRASDIHIEPFRDGLKVRMRVDGLLRAVPTPIHVLPQALVSRIKILGRAQHR